MALLDFIKNRHSQQAAAEQQSQQQHPETAKQMYSREAGEEKTAAKPVRQISNEQMARVDKVGTDLQKAMQVRGTENVPSTPTEGTDNAQPMRQPMMNQDKAAPALSPTSAQAGTHATEQESTAPSQDKSQSRSRTIARTMPSWER